MSWGESLALAFKQYTKFLYSVILDRVGFSLLLSYPFSVYSFFTFLILFGRFLVNNTLFISAFPHILQETKFLILWFSVLSFFRKQSWWSLTICLVSPKSFRCSLANGTILWLNSVIIIRKNCPAGNPVAVVTHLQLCPIGLICVISIEIVNLNA